MALALFLTVTIGGRNRAGLGESIHDGALRRLECLAGLAALDSGALELSNHPTDKPLAALSDDASLGIGLGLQLGLNGLANLYLGSNFSVRIR